MVGTYLLLLLGEGCEDVVLLVEHDFEHTGAVVVFEDRAVVVEGPVVLCCVVCVVLTNHCTPILNKDLYSNGQILCSAEGGAFDIVLGLVYFY